MGMYLMCEARKGCSMSVSWSLLGLPSHSVRFSPRLPGPGRALDTVTSGNADLARDSEDSQGNECNALKRDKNVVGFIYVIHVL